MTIAARRERKPPRNCPRCVRPLSPAREAKRKKYCFACESQVRAAQREAAHDRRVEKLYGLLPGEYRKLYEAQGGRCAIFNCHARGIRIALAVDHDHAFGLHNRAGVRGLLCKRHNRIIGDAGDDPRVFESLAGYLREPPAWEVLQSGIE